MKCHYEILGLSPECTAEDIKKSYRKLALEWHPDKNLERLSEATEIFQLIQQAYEILIDPQERAWYDRHKDDILRGDAEEAYKDDCLNVYQYFNASCFKGYGDDEKGFYTVYNNVFAKIASEDQPFQDENETLEVPSFGSSESSYEEVVHNFYAYWQSYCTAKSYSWNDQFNLTEARKCGAGRYELRKMEKENKKVRDKCRKDRNEEIRQLVSFVRKRDKRVQAHKKKEEERKIEKAKRAEELRKQQVLERNKSLESYTESEWLSKSNLDARFTELESRLDATFGAASENDTDEEVDDYSAALYCAACEKDFKTEKAMKNHENSKKHKENLLLLKYLMKEEDELYFNSESPNEEAPAIEEAASDTENEVTSEALLEELVRSSSSKSKKKKKKNKNGSLDVTLKVEQCDELNNILEEIKIDGTPIENEIPSESLQPKSEPSKKNDKHNKVIKEKLLPETLSEEGEKASTICETCCVDYKSRNKLFNHLKESGHAVYKNGNAKQNSSRSSKKKQKAKKL